MKTTLAKLHCEFRSWFGTRFLLWTDDSQSRDWLSPFCRVLHLQFTCLCLMASRVRFESSSGGGGGRAWLVAGDW